MRQRLSAAAVVVLVAAAVVGAQTTIDYLNGIPYTWPASQGDADQLLTNDGTGTLAWSDPPSAEGLWSGVIVPSLVDCPVSGWTRVSAADGALLVPAAATGSTGGSATHTHALSGLTGGTVVTVSGTSAASTVSLSGSTAVTSISHTHGTTTGSTVVGGFPPSTFGLASITVSNYNPSHSHAVGTLAGGSHTHGTGTLVGTSHGHTTGTLAIADASSFPAYLDVVLCMRD